METRKVELGEIKDCNISTIKNLVRLRTQSADEFINEHASGTLRKNKKLGFTWRSQYLEERVAYEYGWEFEIQPRSRVLIGIPFTEGDESAVTEAGWHAERYIERTIFPEDIFVVRYINVEYSWGEKKEGIGLVCKQTSAHWIPGGHTIFAFISEFDPNKGEWKEAVNPF